MKKAVLLLLMLVVTALGQSKPTAKSQRLTLIHVTIIDVTGAPAKPDMTVAIDGEKIVQIGQSRKLKTFRSSRIMGYARASRR